MILQFFSAVHCVHLESKNIESFVLLNWKSMSCAPDYVMIPPKWCRLARFICNRISKGRDPGEGIAFVENPADSAKHRWREMQAGEFDIERIAEYRITGYRRSEKISYYLIEEIPLPAEPLLVAGATRRFGSSMLWKAR